jgi:Family of unknown function (DUF6152)
VKRISLAVGLLSFSLFSLPLFGHHSFAAEYDRNKQFDVKGTVTKVEWMNPHAYFYLDVKDESSGKVVNWAFELGNLSTLMRQGWRKDSLKPGDVVTVQAYRAKDGSNLGNGRSVVLADGRKVFGASSAGDVDRGN